MLSVVPRMEFGGTPPSAQVQASSIRFGLRPTLNAIFIFCLFEEAAGQYGKHLPSLRGKWVRHGHSHPSPIWMREWKRTRGVRAGPAEGTGSPGGGRLGVG